MSLCTTCTFETTFLSIPNSQSSQVCWGKQILHLYFQSMSGSTFDGSTVSGTPATAGGDIEEETDWAAKAGADPDDVNKIIAIKSLSGASIPEPTNQELSGNDVPGGGTIITEQTYTLPFRLIYLSKAGIEAYANLSCWPLFRFWFQDDQGYLWQSSNDIGAGAGISGGIINSKVATRGLNFPGKGQPLPTNANATISWADQIPTPVSATPFTFLDTVFPV